MVDEEERQSASDEEADENDDDDNDDNDADDDNKSDGDDDVDGDEDEDGDDSDDGGDEDDLRLRVSAAQQAELRAALVAAERVLARARAEAEEGDHDGQEDEEGDGDGVVEQAGGAARRRKPLRDSPELGLARRIVQRLRRRGSGGAGAAAAGGGGDADEVAKAAAAEESKAEALRRRLRVHGRDADHWGVWRRARDGVVFEGPAVDNHLDADAPRGCIRVAYPPGVTAAPDAPDDGAEVYEGDLVRGVPHG